MPGTQVIGQRNFRFDQTHLAGCPRSDVQLEVLVRLESLIGETCLNKLTDESASTVFRTDILVTPTG
jgi:hypothetical protein